MTSKKKEYFDIKGSKNEDFTVPVIYKTKNLILHRTWETLKRNFHSKEREYSITWHNGTEVYRLISVSNVNIGKVKIALDILQASKNYDLAVKSTKLGKNLLFKELCYDLRNELNVHKGDNL
jgi:hypothetical protein